MGRIAAAPGALLRAVGRLLRRGVVAITGVAILATLMLVLDAVLLRDRSGRPGEGP